MAKSAIKCKSTECEECPEWIFTFADLVMLMMGFFVILWVLKPAPGKEGEPKQELPIEVLAAIREAFGYLPDSESKDPVDMHMILRKLEQLKPMKGQGDGGNTQRPRKSPEGQDVDSTAIRPGKESIVGGRVLFAQGKVTLTSDATASLDEVVKFIKGHRNVVLVKGHTSLDDLPDTATPREKLEVSLRRATAVAEYLVSRGVEPDALRVQGCSTFEPVVQRVYTEERRVLNRRVEVEATPTLISDLQDPAKPAPDTMRGEAATQPAGDHRAPARGAPASPASGRH